MDIQNILQVLALIVAFVIILFLTYYVTKWIAKSGAIPLKTQNIRVVETFKIAPNKYIQIIQLGSRYYAIGVSKENITFLTSLEEEQLDLVETSTSQQMSFKDLLGKFAKNNKK